MLTGYKVGDTLNFSIIVTNEGTAPLTTFNLRDNMFAGNVTNMICDNGFVTFAGQTMTPATPIAAGASYETKCTVTITSSNGILINTATLTLPSGEIVTPSGMSQSDGNTSTPADKAKDSVVINPLPATPRASVVKKWTGTAPISYKAGDTLNFSIVVTNEGIVPLSSIRLVDNLFAGSPDLGLTTCNNGFAAFAGQDFNFTTPIAVGANITFLCSTPVNTVSSTTNAVNTVTLTVPNGEAVPPLPTNPQSDGNVTTPTDIAKDSILVPGELAPRASIVKKWTGTAPASYTIGDTLRFSIIVTNEGTAPLASFVLADDLFAGSSALGATTCDNGFVTFAGQTMTPATPIASNASLEIRCSSIVTGTSGRLTNTATIQVPNGVIVQPQVTNPKSNPTSPINQDTVSVDTTPSRLSIVKKWMTPAPTVYKTGDTLNFAIVIGNEGSNPVSQFRLSDNMFAGSANLTGMVCDNGYTAYNGQNFSLATPIAPGADMIISCTIVVSSMSGPIINTATLEFPGGQIVPPTRNTQTDGNTSTPVEIAKDVITLNPAPQISIIKRWTSMVTDYTDNSVLEYDIVINNEGTVPVTNINIADDSFAGNTDNVCTIGITATEYPFDTMYATNIAVGNNLTLKCRAIVKPSTAGLIINTVMINPTTPAVVVPPSVGTQTDGNVSNPVETSKDSITVTQQPLDISVVKTVEKSEYKMGDLVKFNLVITNNSNIVAPTVALSDILPEGLMFIAMTQNGSNVPYTTVNGNDVTVLVGDMQPQTSITYELTAQVKVKSATNLTNVVAVATSRNETNLDNNTSTAVITVKEPIVIIPGLPPVMMPTMPTITPRTGGEIGLTGVFVVLAGIVILSFNKKREESKERVE